MARYITKLVLSSPKEGKQSSKANQSPLSWASVIAATALSLCSHYSQLLEKKKKKKQLRRETSLRPVVFSVICGCSLENHSFQEASFLSVLFLFHFTVTPLGFVELWVEGKALMHEKGRAAQFVAWMTGARGMNFGFVNQENASCCNMCLGVDLQLALLAKQP